MTWETKEDISCVWRVADAHWFAPCILKISLEQIEEKMEQS